MWKSAAPPELSLLRFLIIHVAGLVVLWGTAWCARRGVRRCVLPGTLPELSTVELAYLHDGADRSAETVLARLVSRRKLRVVEPGVLVAVGGSKDKGRGRRKNKGDSEGQGEGDALDSVVLRAAREPAGTPGLLQAAKQAPEMAAVVSRLRDNGLVSSARTRALRRYGPPALIAAWLVLWVAWVISSGLSGARPSVANGVKAAIAPEGLLVCMSIVGLCATDGAFRTRAGTAIVKALRRARRDGRSMDGSAVLACYGPQLQGDAGVVAVSGLFHYPDPDMRTGLWKPPSYRGSSGGP
ncbi:TIGR04222 domain-containing membrane protein [Streptomyces sp. NPDC058221]|uniref:TIGR04222 domain-containing membrane protein n=1 Tax=Streptomyces sp. NPDC058221 TaxID=3346388 RepID=UPI0036EAE65E